MGINITLEGKKYKKCKKPFLSFVQKNIKKCNKSALDSTSNQILVAYSKENQLNKK